MLQRPLLREAEGLWAPEGSVIGLPLYSLIGGEVKILLLFVYLLEPYFSFTVLLFLPRD